MAKDQCPNCNSWNTDTTTLTDGYGPDGLTMFQCNDCGHTMENGIVTTHGIKAEVKKLYDTVVKLEEVLIDVLDKLPHGGGLCQCEDPEKKWVMRRETDPVRLDIYCLQCGGTIDVK